MFRIYLKPELFLFQHLKTSSVFYHSSDLFRLESNKLENGCRNKLYHSVQPDAPSSRWRLPPGGHPAGGAHHAPHPHRGRHSGVPGKHGGPVDLLLQAEVLEPQRPVPLQPGHRGLPGPGEPASEDRRLAPAALGVRRRHVPHQPLPDVFQPIGQHRAHDRGGHLPLHEGEGGEPWPLDS